LERDSWAVNRILRERRAGKKLAAAFAPDSMPRRIAPPGTIYSDVIGRDVVSIDGRSLEPVSKIAK
jgi:hypothetical protein